MARALNLPRTVDAPGAVALTFDDGPHPRGTPAILEVLAAADATATFFMVGEQVNRSPRLAAEVVAAGHGVAVHGHRHRNLLRLTPRQIADDFDRARTAIEDTTRTAPTLHRAPYGIYSWPALAAVRARGWTPVLWSAWGRDWARGATGESVSSLVLRDLRPGGIVLLHDADDYSVPGSWRATVSALPRILDAVATRGLRTVALRQGR
jgi:peptidoglycan/xylan/chitin deacetylase (PgdA/CDA1 family)